MALHSKTEAAKMAGVSRATIHRKVSNGLLSAQSGMIETSELLRIYPNSKLSNDGSSVTPDATLMLKHEYDLLKKDLDAKDAKIEALETLIDNKDFQIKLIGAQSNQGKAWGWQNTAWITISIVLSVCVGLLVISKNL